MPRYRVCLRAPAHVEASVLVDAASRREATQYALEEVTGASWEIDPESVHTEYAYVTDVVEEEA